jgi:hypothetical protein
MRKIPGVKTVRVSLNDGLTVLDLDSGNAVTLGQLRTVLKNSGFVSKEAQLEARGVVVAKGHDIVFTVAGTSEDFPLLASATNPAVYEALKQRAEAGPVTAQLKGLTDPPGKAPPTLTIEAVQ